MKLWKNIKVILICAASIAWTQQAILAAERSPSIKRDRPNSEEFCGCSNCFCPYIVNPDGTFSPVPDDGGQPASGTQALPSQRPEAIRIRDQYRRQARPEWVAMMTVFMTAHTIAVTNTETLTESDKAILKALDPQETLNEAGSQAHQNMTQVCRRVLNGEFSADNAGQLAEHLRQVEAAEREGVIAEYEQLKASLSGQGAELIEQTKDRYLRGVGGTRTNWPAFSQNNPGVLVEGVREACENRGLPSDF